jgi:hypothetical protein
MNNKSIVITAAVAIIFAAGGFYGGISYQKSKIPAVGSFRGANRTPGDGQGRPQGQGFNRGGGSNGDFVVGEITVKDDTSITVKTRDGGSKIVYFSDTTSIGKATEGTSGDLSVGQQVTIGGKANQDGSYAAQNIQIRPDMPNFGQQPKPESSEDINNGK